MHTINGLVEELLLALDAKDANRICSIVVDDAAMVDEITRGWVIGRENLRKHLEATLVNVESITSSLKDLRVREVGTFASVTCTLLQRYRFGGETVDVVAPMSLSAEHGGDGWRIVHMHAVPLSDG